MIDINEYYEHEDVKNLLEMLGIDMQHMVNRICDVCGKEFKAPYSEVNPGGVFCSKYCAQKGK